MFTSRRNPIDFAALTAVLGAIVGWLPAVAAVLGIVWYFIQIYESKTIQEKIAAWRLRRNNAKLIELRAREKVIQAKLKAIEKVAVATVIADEKVAAAEATATEKVQAAGAKVADLQAQT